MEGDPFEKITARIFVAKLQLDTISTTKIHLIQPQKIGVFKGWNAATLSQMRAVCKELITKHSLMAAPDLEGPIAGVFILYQRGDEIRTREVVSSSFGHLEIQDNTEGTVSRGVLERCIRLVIDFTLGQSGWFIVRDCVYVKGDYHSSTDQDAPVVQMCYHLSGANETIFSLKSGTARYRSLRPQSLMRADQVKNWQEGQKIHYEPEFGSTCTVLPELNQGRINWLCMNMRTNDREPCEQELRSNARKIWAGTHDYDVSDTLGYASVQILPNAYKIFSVSCLWTASGLTFRPSHSNATAICTDFLSSLKELSGFGATKQLLKFESQAPSFTAGGWCSAKRKDEKKNLTTEPPTSTPHQNETVQIAQKRLPAETTEGDVEEIRPSTTIRSAVPAARLPLIKPNLSQHPMKSQSVKSAFVPKPLSTKRKPEEGEEEKAAKKNKSQKKAAIAISENIPSTTVTPPSVAPPLVHDSMIDSTTTSDNPSTTRQDDTPLPAELAHTTREKADETSSTTKTSTEKSMTSPPSTTSRPAPPLPSDSAGTGSLPAALSTEKKTKKVVEADPVAVATSYAAGNVNKLSLPILKAFLKSVGQKVGGKKEELVARVCAHFQAQTVGG
ncbi:hypothetical protein PROFUN_05063 [Planoprotostelium fungivorum]|uniref:SAP domain-containing protein n=1 Tax=Planoprotostelium fungivorum TaxID=1890364 RepID=A0A2P6NSB8_9EUKA|nr:hypothetical protein PROFUN_05063 [Planoprotostelium fungivorum]